MCLPESSHHERIEAAFNEKGLDPQTTLYHAVLMASLRDSFHPLQKWCSKWSKERATCPVEDHEFIANLYLLHDFAPQEPDSMQPDSLEEEAKAHLSILSDNGWDEIRKRLIKERHERMVGCSEDARSQRSEALLLMCWLKDPTFSILETDGEESATHFDMLLELFRVPEFADLRSRVRAKLKDKQPVSQMALFLCFPECLDVTSFNSFAKRFKGTTLQRYHAAKVNRSYEEIVPSMLLIGQLGSSVYPPYFVKLCCRSTHIDLLTTGATDGSTRWPELNKALTDDTLNDRITVDDIRNNDWRKLVKLVKLSSGLSLTTMQANIRALWLIMQAFLSHKKVAEKSGTVCYVHNVLWAWFFAVPFAESEVMAWLEMLQPFDGDGSGKDPRTVSVPTDAQTFNALTYLPFPSSIDIYVDTNVGVSYVLFGETKNDAHYTIQCLQPLLATEEHRLQWSDASELLEKIETQDGMSHFRCDRDKAKELVRMCAVDVAEKASESVLAIEGLTDSDTIGLLGCARCASASCDCSSALEYT